MAMPQTTDTDEKFFAATDVGTDAGRRATLVPAPAAASAELVDRPRRRTFTAKDKLRILGEVDRAASVLGGL
jgi:transposase